MFRYAVRRGIAPSNPVRLLERGDRPSGKRQTEPRYLDRGQIDRLLDERAEPSAPALPDPAAITAVRNRLRDEARQVRHGLIIQREAVGLVSHALVEQRYAIPPRRRSPEFDPARRRARHE